MFGTHFELRSPHNDHFLEYFGWFAAPWPPSGWSGETENTKQPKVKHADNNPIRTPKTELMVDCTLVSVTGTFAAIPRMPYQPKPANVEN